MPADPDTKYRVLLLDDDRRFLETVSELFTIWSQDRWQVFPAINTARALALLQEQRFDLAVVDVNMPVVDGIQFLRLLNQRYPQLKKVVITGYADETKRNECLANGAELFIEKPRTQDGFGTVFATLNELLGWQAQEGSGGALRKVSLQDVIQMECLGRNSSLLEIAGQQSRGRIYIEHGNIIHAMTDGHTGVSAFNHLLRLTDCEFSIKPFEPPPEPTIDAQWEMLLMEAARLRNEYEKASAVASGPSPTGGEAAAMEGFVATALAEEPHLLELMLCSGEGTVLYEWQCRGADQRLRLFSSLAQSAQVLAQLLPLGAFDRLEVNSGATRAVAQLAADRRLFVRVGFNETPAAPVG